MSEIFDGLKSITKGTVGLGKGAANFLEGVFGISKEGFHYGGKGLEQVQRITGGEFLKGFCKCILKNGKQCRNKVKGLKRFCVKHLKKSKKRSPRKVRLEIEHSQNEDGKPLNIEIEHSGEKKRKSPKRKIKKLVKQYYDELKDEKKSSEPDFGFPYERYL